MRLIASEFISGEPKAQPRTRASSFGGGRARIYDPGTANGWKNLIAQELKKHAGRCVTCPIYVNMTFYFARPKSHFGTGKNANVLKKSAPNYHIVKPDNDNLEKAVWDCLSHKSGIGLWQDDCQIVKNLTIKKYADDGNAGLGISIYELGAKS